MKIEFSKILDGIARYIDKEIYPGMNDWQELVVRVAVGRILTGKEALQANILNNPIIRSFVLIDDSGMVEIDTLLADVKRELAKKGSVQVAIPLLGNLKFVEGDIDRLRSYIL